VISTTPLKGIGLPIEKIPATVQTVKAKDIAIQRPISLADYINNNLMGVSINEVQNNPYQPDVRFRGFTASPLLGTPQGLSVFQDGVRVNELFGDVVNWDLIPNNAIAGINLMSGSNPVFGLNTLGGALSVTTKNGRTHQGGGIEVSTGSWQRQNVSGEYGGVSKDGAIDYFFSANYFDEDGWRDYSPTTVKQVFGKVGWQNETSRLELSYTGADNDMIGNGLVQKQVIDQFGRSAINTQPDQTENKMSFLNLNGSHWLSDQVELTANVYYRNSERKTLNGDINDDFDEDNGDLAECIAGAEEDEAEQSCSGALNRSLTDQKGYGINLQLAFNQDVMGKSNLFIAGADYNYSKIEFNQLTEFGLINAQQGVNSVGVEGDEGEVDLEGKTNSYSLFFTDTMSLTDQWHVTLSGRYNHVKVVNDDIIHPTGTSFINGEDETLSGNHSFNRFNPAVGVSYTPTKSLSLHGSYNEGMRAPTSMELGCANPKIPCKLPNSMAADPVLKKVVAKTFEVGGRGKIAEGVGWSAAVYRTENHDDIHFIATNAAGLGYFDNVGKTRRQGFDGSLMADYGKLSWRASYSYVDATYQTPLELSNEVNSTADDDVIQVQKGDQLAGVPEHSFKLRVQYQATANWSVGATFNRFSEVYAMGNENNDHQAGVGVNQEGEDAVAESGVISGYTVVNLDTRYKFGNTGWQLFAKATNIFDKEYSTGGLLGENWFQNGQFSGEDEPALMLMPGAPRAGWVGVRYDFK
jgi:outer membrane receptor protein involved in Fe transport